VLHVKSQWAASQLMKKTVALPFSVDEDAVMQAGYKEDGGTREDEDGGEGDGSATAMNLAQRAAPLVQGAGVVEVVEPWNDDTFIEHDDHF
jgi:hypothetical protein